MGTGIMAAIPIVFTPPARRPLDERDFVQGFFDNYDTDEADGEKSYVIKEKLLIDNYRPFLSEFYDLIGEDFTKESKLTYATIPDAKDFSEFAEAFRRENRNYDLPYVFESSFAFSVLGCRCEKYWLFYSGSYKAVLEVYRTLLHFERILAKAMANPLANAVKFGIFG